MAEVKKEILDAYGMTKVGNVKMNNNKIRTGNGRFNDSTVLLLDYSTQRPQNGKIY